MEQSNAGNPAELKVLIGSRHVQVFRRGEGPVHVVFEAGGGCGGEVWRAVQQLLPDGMTSWSYDRAGQGGSPSNGDWSLDSSLDDLQAWMAAVGVTRPALFVGHSMGCHVVRAYAQRHPADVSGMVLIDARPPGFEQRVLDAGIAIAVPPPETSIVQEVGRADAVIAALPNPGMESTVVISSDHFDAAPGELNDAEITAVAAIWRSSQSEIAEAFGQSAVIVAPGAGHAIPVEAPEFVASIIADLVAGQ